MKSDGTREATEPEVATATSDDPFPGLFRRCVRKKEIRWAGGTQVVELDIIVASAREWENCVERHEGQWNEVVRDGVVIAERSIV